MLRLLRLISLLTLVLIAGLVAIIGLTYRNTNRWDYLFTRPDENRCETPCVFGADAATMDFEQADATISASTALKWIKIQRNKETQEAYYSTDELVVGTSQLGLWVWFSPTNSPTLGEFLVLLGTPEKMALPHWGMYCNSAVFYIQDKVIDLEIKGRGPQRCISGWGWGWEIARIHVYRARPETSNGFVPWQTFNVYNHYPLPLGDGN